MLNVVQLCCAQVTHTHAHIYGELQIIIIINKLLFICIYVFYIFTFYIWNAAQHTLTEIIIKKSEQHHTYITTSNQNVKTEKALNCVFKPELGTRYEMSL